MHIGKIGKFALRRDFTLNWDLLSNNQWFDSFIFLVPHMPDGIASDLQGHTFKTFATQYIGIDTMFWDTPVITIKGLEYTMQLTSTIKDWDYRKFGQITLVGYGPIWKWSYRNNGDPGDIANFGSGTFPTSVFFDPIYLDSMPQNPAGVRPRFWSDGPGP